MRSDDASGKIIAGKKIVPWSPSSIALITLIFSILPGAILYHLNFKRLGYTGRPYPSLLTNILIYIITIII